MQINTKIHNLIETEVWSYRTIMSKLTGFARGCSTKSVGNILLLYSLRSDIPIQKKSYSWGWWFYSWTERHQFTSLATPNLSSKHHQFKSLKKEKRILRDKGGQGNLGGWGIHTFPKCMMFLIRSCRDIKQEQTLMEPWTSNSPLHWEPDWLVSMSTAVFSCKLLVNDYVTSIKVKIQFDPFRS